MEIELRYAALDDAVEQRVRFAAQALAAHRIRAQASSWDGTQADVVVVNADDGYGRHVMEIARRRGTPVLALGGDPGLEPQAVLRPETATVSAIAKSLRELLSRRNGPASALPPPATTEESLGHSPVEKACALTRLATDPQWANVDLEATFQGTTVWLLPRSGRVLSANVGAQLHARAMLGQDGWSFAPLGEHRRANPIGPAAASLDAFYMQGAWTVRSSLPSFPAASASLREWPDLGGAAEIVDALKVVKVLQRGGASPARIRDESGVGEAEVSACLWAFSASGILERRVTAPSKAEPPQGRSARSGLFARLAVHFGLLRH